MEEFDRLLKETVAGNKMSASRIKKLTSLAMAHPKDALHITSSLYKTQKKAQPTNKLVAFYILDSILRAAFESSKRENSDESGSKTASPKTASSSSSSSKVTAGAGTLLRKLSSAVEELVEDILRNGLPEYKGKVRKVMDIWSRSGMLSATMLARLRASHFAGANNGEAAASTDTVNKNAATETSTKSGPPTSTATSSHQETPAPSTDSGSQVTPLTTLPAPRTANDLLALLAAHAASRSGASNGTDQSSAPALGAEQLAILQRLSTAASAAQATATVTATPEQGRPPANGHVNPSHEQPEPKRRRESPPDQPTMTATTTSRNLPVNLVDDKAAHIKAQSSSVAVSGGGGSGGKETGVSRSRDARGPHPGQNHHAPAGDSMDAMQQFMGGSFEANGTIPVLPDYDWTHFDPSSTESWSTLGTAYEAAYGQAPSPEIVMQMVMYRQMMMMMTMQ